MMKKLCLVCLLLLSGCMPLTYQGHIDQYHSLVDQDGDGIDDQIDILQNAKAYLKTRPKYKSQYYQSGYPDDGYGVCTDVVAQALLHSGYDLQKLVDQDIKSHPEWYNHMKADSKIDFRRVRNLHIYFSHHATSLTLDLNQIDEFQGGDIIVFKKHIGILSNKRNRHGVPYVLHHAYPHQLFYEQNILERRSDVIGHYRIS